ncbi:asparagine synthase (glutamine-hydrolyzing) [Candidatus Uhrbacteria bacterium]|nr:asparagine synthase (glutamine-hydrolyzing) [Candidatus Uhrbacteria bacterium]
MCGIAGVIGTSDQVQEGVLRSLAASLAHRGPNDEGIEQFSLHQTSNTMVGLVHRRLAIIDCSPTGHQPMCDAVAGNWIVFNGEIYNYRELRAELERLKHVFRSQSDTEVILKAYAQYGVGCVDKLRGMFAFAVVDVSKQKIFIAVDRFGIKPLYVYRKDTVFAFASEMKALLSAGIVPRVVDQEAVQSFLSFGAVQAPLTMIRGVRAVLPGEYVVYEPISAKMESGLYWRISASEAQPPAGPGAQGVGAILEDTVRHHLVADVPIGLFLSGGVDSSALAVLAHRVAGRALDSFSVTFEEKDYAEGKFARMIGERFCARHHELIIREADFEQLLPGALDAQDQPTIDGVNAYVISKAVHDVGINVVLSGQGGDEVFGGYSTFRRIPRMLKWWKIVRRMSKGQRMAIARIIGNGSITRSKIGQYLSSRGEVPTFYQICRQLFSEQSIALLMPSVRPRSVKDAPVFEVDREKHWDLFTQISQLELTGYLANMLLRDGDVMSMAHGLEVRVPYLDPVLLDRVFSSPVADKVKQGIPKPLLLNAVRDDLPHEIWAREKMGFTFPWEEWLRGRLRTTIEEVLHDRDAAGIIELDGSVCQQMWRQFLSHHPAMTWSRLWAVYVLLRWSRNKIL